MKHYQMQFGHFLRGYLTASKAKNASYSLRSFSKKLGMNSGNLSQILSGKRPVSRNKVSQILEKLNVEENDVHKILFSEKSNYENFIFDKYFSNFSSYKEISCDKLNDLLSTDLNFKIMALSETNNFELDASWIANKLGANIDDVRTSLNFLVEREDINIEKNHKKINSYYKTSDGVKSTAIRNLHKNTLTEAMDKINALPTSKRDLTSTIFSCSPKKYKEAQQLIRSFQKQLVSLMSSGAEKSQVYKLNVQLYPCTNSEEFYEDEL